jgi:hypothetical protein
MKGLVIVTSTLQENMLRNRYKFAQTFVLDFHLHNMSPRIRTNQTYSIAEQAATSPKEAPLAPWLKSTFPPKLMLVSPVGQHLVWVVPELLDEGEDVVPAATVEA